MRTIHRLRWLVLVVLTSPGCDDTGATTSDLDASVSDAAVPPDLAPPSADSATDGGAVTTVIRVHYPAGAHAVTIRGSLAPLDWNAGTVTTAGADDTYTFTTSALTAPAEWKPLLDDSTWSRGANYRVAPGQTVDAYPHFATASGRVVTLFAAFHSDLLGNDRAVYAYLPPSYDENPRARYPVLYMHDGQNLFDPALAFGGQEWKVDEALDAGAEVLARADSIREIVVNGVANTNDRVNEYTPTRDASEMAGGRGPVYVRMLVEELKPRVDAMLRTRTERGDTGVLGSSLGGLFSAWAGLTRPDVFGLVGAMSPSTWWDGRTIIADVLGAKNAPSRPLRVYVDSGDSGPDGDDAADTRDLAQAWRDIGYTEGADFHYVLQPGALHNEVYWAQRLPGALRFLFGEQQP